MSHLTKSLKPETWGKRQVRLKNSGQKKSKREKYHLAPKPSPQSERLAARANRRVIREYVRLLNQEFGEHFSSIKGLRQDALPFVVTDSDIAAIADRVIERMRPSATAPIWEAWNKDMTAGMASLKRKSAADFERLGLPGEVLIPVSPILDNNVAAAMGRLSASIQKEARTLGSRMTLGRGAATKAEAASVVKALQGNGLSAEVVGSYIDSVEAEARGLIAAEWQAVDSRATKAMFSRAENLARDQILTTNADITAMKMANLGLSRYEWVSQRDGIVRPWHADLDADSQAGQTFSYEDPPMGGGTTAEETGNPGDGQNCRCVGYPSLPIL